MTSLLELKQYIKRFYIKNETYITYVWKFVLAIISIAMINNKLGYMKPLSNIAIVLMASLLCAILPANFIVIISAAFILGHLYAMGIESALIAAVIFLLMFLLLAIWHKLPHKITANKKKQKQQKKSKT